MANARHRVLCRLDDLPDGDSRGFSVEAPEGLIELFLVRRGDAVYGYYNRCPHTGAPLDWSPDRFLDPEHRFIQCSMHGALFVIATGLCVHGPCVDRVLDPVPVRVLGDDIVLAL